MQSNNDRTFFSEFVTFVFAGLVSYIVFTGLQGLVGSGDMNHSLLPWLPALFVAVVQLFFRRPRQSSVVPAPGAGRLALVSAIVVAIGTVLMMAAQLHEADVNLTYQQWGDSNHVLMRGLEGGLYLGSVVVIALGRVASQSRFGRFAMIVGGVTFAILLLWSMFGRGPHCVVLL